MGDYHAFKSTTGGDDGGGGGGGGGGCGGFIIGTTLFLVIYFLFSGASWEAFDTLLSLCFILWLVFK